MPAPLVPFVPSWLDDAGLSCSAFRVLCHLYRRRNTKSHRCNPSVASIALTCRINEDTVWRAMRELQSAGRIRRVASPGRPNQYLLTDPPTGNQGVGHPPETKGPQSLETEGRPPPENRGPEGIQVRESKKVCDTLPPDTHTISHWIDQSQGKHPKVDCLACWPHYADHYKGRRLSALGFERWCRSEHVMVRKDAPELVKQDGPDGWHERLEVLHPGNRVSAERQAWATVPESTKAEILKEMGAIVSG